MDKSDIQETLVSLYLRLNGYFLSGFIVHAAYGVGTEMDVLAVRFPQHKEPEREVQPCDRLAIPPDRIDFIVGEVKGGSNNVNFNVRFRNDPDAICTVLRRFGAFDDAEIDRVCRTVPELLDPKNVRKSPAFPELDVTTAVDIVGQPAKLRFVPFAAEQRRSTAAARPYVFEDDLLAFTWKCLRPEQPRARSGVRYNYELWGPQFVQMVRYLKDPLRTAPGTIEELYRAYET